MALDFTVIFSIAGAFGAAATAQYYSHNLTLKREEEKYKKECYQNLFSPLIFKIINYLNAEEYHRRQVNIKTTPKPDILLAEIVKILEENLKYANPRLIGFYEMTRTKDLLENKESSENTIDLWQESMEYSERMKIFEEFINEYILISKQLNVLSNELERKVLGALAIVKLYNFANHYGLDELSKFILKYGNIVVSTLTVNGTFAKIEEINNDVKNSIELTKRHTGKESWECYSSLVGFIHDLDNEFSKYAMYKQFYWEELKKAIDNDLYWLEFALRRTGNY